MRGARRARCKQRAPDAADTRTAPRTSGASPEDLYLAVSVEPKPLAPRVVGGGAGRTAVRFTSGFRPREGPRLDGLDVQARDSAVGPRLVLASRGAPRAGERRGPAPRAGRRRGPRASCWRRRPAPRARLPGPRQRQGARLVLDFQAHASVKGARVGPTSKVRASCWPA
jgi:hypothetical protein